MIKLVSEDRPAKILFIFLLSVAGVSLAMTVIYFTAHYRVKSECALRGAWLETAKECVFKAWASDFDQLWCKANFGPI